MMTKIFFPWSSFTSVESGGNVINVQFNKKKRGETWCWTRRFINLNGEHWELFNCKIVKFQKRCKRREEKARQKMPSEVTRFQWTGDEFFARKCVVFHALSRESSQKEKGMEKCSHLARVSEFDCISPFRTEIKNELARKVCARSHDVHLNCWNFEKALGKVFPLISRSFFLKTFLIESG